MAIYVETNEPENLVLEIIKSINNNKITSWECDKDGDFTPKLSENIDNHWHQKAWFKANIFKSTVIFDILKNPKYPFTKEINSIYHSRFVEMLMNHLSNYFDIININSKNDPEYDQNK
jgi:hypothetical protein